MADGKKSEEHGVRYWEYIGLDDLLSLQHPKTDAHDEMQFIMVHQAFEIWFRLAIYELREVIARLEKGDLAGGQTLMHRVGVILRSAVKGFDPLVTMSMQGYAAFRDALTPASGFQSVQFRVIELLLGIEPDEEDRFYWEHAVQAGETYHAFMGKYQEGLRDELVALKGRTLRRIMLRLVEESTDLVGAESYREVHRRRNDFPDHYALAESARDLQQAVIDFRLGHHKVTVFSIGAHAAGTSDSHAADHPSCAQYLLNVIRDRATIFPELEEALS